MKILIINGPNLNLLGSREMDIYGNISFPDHFQDLKSRYKFAELEYFQSNIEGELINKLHDCGFSYNGIILNAGGYTHTSVAIGDAIKAITSPVIEVHISNVQAREEFRSRSMISGGVQGIIAGFGLDVYRMAIEKIISDEALKS